MNNKCWWCLHPSETIQSIGQYLKDRKISSKEQFCSFECCYAFMIRWQYAKNDIAALMNNFHIHSQSSSILLRASDPFTLKEPYGGDLDIEQFRRKFHSFNEVDFDGKGLDFNNHTEIMLKSYRERQQYLRMIQNK